MGKLDEKTFEAAIAAGCLACGHGVLEIRTFLDRSVEVMLGDPNNAGKWAHDGEKFVDGTYRMTCAACQHVAFADAMCPRCNASDGLARALAETSRLTLPKRCPKCNETELLAIALIPAVAMSGAGTPKPKPLAEAGEPGYHFVAFACESCDNAVVAQACPLCDAPGPLRVRP
jgi:RNA polymerase subunit RPABC4/transcription elongation factor Spt4